MNEICPNSKSACFFEMVILFFQISILILKLNVFLIIKTPGVLKEAVQEVRNLRTANNSLQCNNDIMNKSVNIQQVIAYM